MLDYLLDAMDEISDEHITEAVNYEAKAKKVNFRKLIPLAACFVFVIVAVIAGAGLFEVAPPTTEPTNIGEPTYAPTTLGPTCAPIRDWDDMNYGERFSFVTINGMRYTFCDETVSADIAGNSLGSEKVSVEYLKDDFRSATAEIYEIKDASTDTFLAVKFTEDEKSDYFLYYNLDYVPATLGDYLDDINAVNNINFIDRTIVYRVDYPNGDFKKVTYGVDGKTQKQLWSLLWGCRETPFEIKSYDDKANEKVEIHTEVMSQSHMIYLTNEGELYTYFGVDDDMFCFGIGEDKFKDFISYLENEAEAIETVMGSPTALVTMQTTQPTTEGSTLPPTNENFHEVEKVFGTAKTLGDIIDGFDIEKADYGISGDMTVDLFAHLEENGKDDITYSIAADTTQQLVDFMQKHSGSKAENRRCRADVRLIFSAYFMGNSGIICLGDDGYLYISCGGITKAFYVGEDAYRDFKENLIAVVWTTENPVTFG